MDTSLFTDLLSAAMSESGLTDLETYDDQPVADSGTQLVASAQSAGATPTSQTLMSVSVQPQQIQMNSIVLQHPRLQTPVRPVIVENSADSAKGVHKIVIRPLPTGLQQSMSSRQLRPVVLQSTGNRQPIIPTTVTSGQTTVRPVLPVLRTVIPHTGSSAVIHSQTAPSPSPVSIPNTTVRPTLSSGTLRFTAIPRHVAARLPSSEANVSLQIRPRLPASVIVPRTVAAVTGNIMHSLPALNQPGVPLTTSNFVPQLPSSVSSSAMMSLSSLSGSVSSSAAQPVASTATGYVSSVATVSCISSVPTTSGMQITTSCFKTDSANKLSVVSASSHSELSLMQTKVMSQADTQIDSCSTVVSSALLSSDQMARCTCTSGTVTVSRGSVVSSGSVRTVTSLEQSGDLGSTLTSSENLTVTAANAAIEHTATASKSDCSAFNCSATNTDDQQVR